MYKVLVYGSLKEGRGNHPLLDGYQKLSNGTVDGFIMYSLGAFPAVRRDDGTIHVEQYEVDDIGLARLDRLEGEPHFYERQTVEYDGESNFIYVLSDSYFKNIDKTRVVEDGNW
jgi:gamma-glutamylcyclotransferase (GGCT)/AIG2-like uncharacterized protein YtfP